MNSSDDYSAHQKPKSLQNVELSVVKESDEDTPKAPERPAHTLSPEKQPLPAYIELQCESKL